MRISGTVTLALLFLVALPAAAQPGPGRGSPEQRIARQLDTLTVRLALTPEQATRVEAILKESAAKARADMEGGSGDREAMRATMQKRVAESDARIEALLTDDQKPKFEQYKKDRAARLRARMEQQEAR